MEALKSQPSLDAPVEALAEFEGVAWYVLRWSLRGDRVLLAHRNGAKQGWVRSSLVKILEEYNEGVVLPKYPKLGDLIKRASSEVAFLNYQEQLRKG